MLMHLQFKRIRRALLIAVALILLAGSDAGSAQRGARPTVETVQFRSTLVGKTLPYNVVLPGDYRASRVTRYPVLYLLHGLTGHYSDWVNRSNVADYASKYRIIIVMPEGNDGWYTDSASVPSDKYESYFIREVMPDVQKRYRTIDSRYGRGVAGLSMGGYGALKFGLKYPATFAFAGSMSGALRPASWTEEELKDFKAIRDSVFSVFGPMGSETRKANDIHQLARSASAARISALPYFYLDCGTEDVLANDNARYAAILHEKKIAHEYRQLPGNHNWQYWDQQVREVLRIAAEKLRAQRASRSRFVIGTLIRGFSTGLMAGQCECAALSPRRESRREMPKREFHCGA
ncbi:MAG TPA: alpha/beta hydrolase family protein [Pyrinomonadaceae bacterium]|nr:alpha/beta hydrolase family protein [Pyrinomonadaceae bacterium]